MPIRKRERVYLSIDIDFWLSPRPAIVGIAKVLRFADENRIPLNVVMNHQQMLPFVNESSARTLLHIDQHSDINSAEVQELNCGTWISYVRWRGAGSFIWVRNNRSTEHGNCNYMFGQWDTGLDWKQFKSEYASQDFNINSHLNDVVGIGICMSPHYTDHNVYDAIKPLVYGRPYRKGRVDEDSVRRLCQPPMIRV